jgi:DNA-binding SARP family transcriptional activator
VSLLGPITASNDEGALVLGGLKQRAVFALLALNAGRVVSLDRLVDELWRDEPPSRATLNLQSYVSRLRRVLSATTSAGFRTVSILTRPPGWVLDLDPNDVDVTAFDAMVMEARHRLATGERHDVAAAAGLLDDALALWLGDPLSGLEGLRFAQEESTRLTDLRLDATELLLQARLELGDTDLVAERAAQFVDVHPFRERAWAAFLLALYRCGRQSEALAASARLRAVLAGELGVDPSPQIRLLEEQILRHDTALEAPSIDIADLRSRAETLGSGPLTTFHMHPQETRSEEGRLTLVGRGDVLSAADSVVAQAVAGSGRLVLLEAPAGLGKSSVLQAIEDRVRGHGGEVFRGDCTAAHAAPALWPWVRVVRGIASVMSSHAHGEAQAAAAARTALALLQADVAEFALPVADPASARRRLYRSVIDSIGAARKAHPLAIIIDDLHWADKETLTLLSLAADELIDAGVLFAVAVRSSEPGAADVAEMMRQLPRASVVRMPLEALRESEIAELVHDIAGIHAPKEVVSLLAARTAGNPLFVSELVRLLKSERRLDLEGVGATLPNEVREVLRRRIDRLPSQTVAMLAVVAVSGGPTDVDVLARVTGVDADSVLDSCESAVLAGLLLDDVDHAGRFVLTHDLVRQTLEQSLSTARRLRLHARIASALQSEAPNPQRVVDLARHLTAAAPVVGHAAAVPYLVAASADALSRHVNDEAERYLLMALEQTTRVEDQDERQMLEGPLRSHLTFLELTVRGEDEQDPPTQTPLDVQPPADRESSMTWLGTLTRLTVTGHAQEAAAQAEAAGTCELEPLAMACVHFISGFANFLIGRLPLAQASLASLETLVRGGVEVRVSGFFDAAVSGAAQSALVAHALGDERGADAWMLLASGRAQGSDQTRLNAAMHRTWLATMRGQPGAAREGASETRVLARRLNYGAYVPPAELITGWADARLGEPKGVDRAVAAWEDYRLTGVRMLTPFYLLLLGEAHATAGLPVDALRFIDQARSARADTGEVCSSPRLISWAESLRPSSP